ncbi:MAG: DegT/DnrJ/EryC1/StrS family aminotransferase [Clostridia bacterium]|nr:DegT/DnrJ/EryC1/StrS family aminotransferase [Clostridia bacterium]
MTKNDLPACLGGKPVCRGVNAPWPSIHKSDIRTVTRVLRSGKISKNGGLYNKQLETEVARKNGRKYAITVANATVGLELALRALGIKSGDEVIVPGYTFYSSVSSIVVVGATPVICDIDVETLNISDKFAEAITEKTRAVMIVDWAGYAVDVSRIRSLIGDRDIRIISDSAQSFGSVGDSDTDYADISVYSFQKSKNLTCGEGGAVATDDIELYKYMYALHNCGRDESCKWYEHKYNGTNIGLSEICAALAVSQLSKFDREVETRKKNAELLISALNQSTVFKVLQTEPIKRRRIYHSLAILCNEKFGSAEEYVMYLRSEGVPVIPSYEKTCDMQEAFMTSGGRCADELTGCHFVCGKAILIPNELLLVDSKNMRLVVKAFEKIEKYFLKKAEKENG